MSKHAIHASVNDSALQQKQRLLARFFTPRYLRGRTVLDLGANAGFYSFWALQNGADKAICVDMDEQYVKIVRDASEHLGIENLDAAEGNITDWNDPADVVFALALVHWLFSCTAVFGTLPRVIQKLASLTKYMLIVEWVSPNDPAIEFFHHIDWNPQHVLGPYTLDAFEAALSENFERFEVVGDATSTRRLYAAFCRRHEVDLSGSLPLIQEKDTVISSRLLATEDSLEYWSRVYDDSPSDMILKQATLDLAEREYWFLNQFQSAYFPRCLFVRSEESFSVVAIEKIHGARLDEVIPEIAFDRERMHTFFTDCLNLLKELQEKRVQHRDIRLDNMLIRDGKPVLIDFGWAVSEACPYISPRGLGDEGRPSSGAYCDVYSMGKLFDRINQHRYEEFDSVIGLMVEEDPSLRITDLATLQLLFDVVAPEGPAARQSRRLMANG